MQLFGEVWSLSVGRGAKVYFELRDGIGAVPCSMWRDEWDALRIDRAALADGVEVVVAGGPDYYPGSHTSSPSFSFLVADLRVAGEGDLLAQLDRRRKALAAEGLLEPQKALHRPVLPRTIGVVTGERGKARDDVLAGLRRRGWAGRLVWAFAPVQDRHAAPAIARAVQDLAAGGVDVIVVARGGGSLADLFAFCDETLCRTVALLPVPVIASVGHHTDRTLIDDVAAVSCSTPTHAAETAVGIDCARRPRGPARIRAAAVGAEPPRRARARPRPGPARPRPRRARGPPPAPPAPADARDARQRPPPGGRRARARAAPPARARAQGHGRHRRRRARSAPATSSACAWPWTPTTPSARSSAVSRWSRTTPASR